MGRDRAIVPVTDKIQVTFVREANAAITAGQVVKYHTDGIKVVLLAVDDGLHLACGVAIEAAASGAQVLLGKSGVFDVNIEGTADVAIGDPLIGDDAVAGALMAHAITTTNETTVVAGVDVASKAVVPLAAQAANSVVATLSYCNF